MRQHTGGEVESDAPVAGTAQALQNQPGTTAGLQQAGFIGLAHVMLANCGYDCLAQPSTTMGRVTQHADVHKAKPLKYGSDS